MTVALSSSLALASDEVLYGENIVNESITVSLGDTLTIENVPVTGAPSSLLLGSGTNQSGTLDVNGGSVFVRMTGTGQNDIYVGRQGGTGTVNMTGGVVTYEGIETYGRLVIGSGTGSLGTFNQSGGSVNAGNGSFYIGTGGGTGVYTLSGSSSLAPGITAYIGRTGGNGTLTLKDNSSMTMTGGDVLMTVGTTGTGLIRQEDNSSVSITIGGAFTIGTGAGGNGTYELVSGSFLVDANRGGAAAGMHLGSADGGTGSFIQSGGTSQFLRNLVAVGYGGTGVFTLTGGTATVEKGLMLGQLAGSNGTLNLNGGVLEVGGTNAIQSGSGTSQVNFGGGTLRVVNSNLTTSSAITLTEDTSSTVDTNARNATLSGVISGEGNLVKAGTGVLTLSGNNDYSGTTDVVEGTLNLAATGKTGMGDVTIGVDGTLTGTGLVQGAATVEGKLNPGTSPGNLTFANGLTLEESSVTTFEVQSYESGNYDTVTLTGGDFALGGTLRIDITSLLEGYGSVDFFDLGADVEVLGNFSTVLLTGVYGNASFSRNGSIWSAILGENSYSLDSSSGLLTTEAVPEPGTVSLVVAGLLLTLMLRRRKAVC